MYVTQKCLWVFTADRMLKCSWGVTNDARRRFLCSSCVGVKCGLGSRQLLRVRSAYGAVQRFVCRVWIYAFSFRFRYPVSTSVLRARYNTYGDTVWCFLELVRGRITHGRCCARAASCWRMTALLQWDERPLLYSRSPVAELERRCVTEPVCYLTDSRATSCHFRCSHPAFVGYVIITPVYLLVGFRSGCFPGGFIAKIMLYFLFSSF
jgi:hypothetical protein